MRMNIELRKGIKGIAIAVAGVTISFLCLWGCNSMHPSMGLNCSVFKNRGENDSKYKKLLSNVQIEIKSIGTIIQALEGLLKRLDKLDNPGLLGNIVSGFQDKTQWLGSKFSFPARIVSCVGCIGIPSYFLYTDHFKQFMRALENELWKNAYLIAENPEEHRKANISSNIPITDTCGFHFQKILEKSVSANDSLIDIMRNYPLMAFVIGCGLLNSAYLLTPRLYALIKYAKQIVGPRELSNKEKLGRLMVLCRELKSRWETAAEAKEKKGKLAKSTKEGVAYDEKAIHNGLKIVVQDVKAYIEENALTEFKKDIDAIISQQNAASQQDVASQQDAASQQNVASQQDAASQQNATSQQNVASQQDVIIPQQVEVHNVP